MHKGSLSFVLAWYITSVAALIFSVFLLFYVSFAHVQSNPSISSYRTYRAQPVSSAATSQEVVINKNDARALIVERFLRERKSPLADQANKFIETADRYKLDFRLLPSIAMHESKGGKIMPNNSNNPFGYGIYGGKVLRFDSFEAAIERVGLGLKNDYIDKGLKTPYQIMTKYTPPSLEKGGPWAISVSSFMEELL